MSGTAAAQTHEGGCLCGRLRYRAEGRPNNVTNCHCRQCQLATGAAVATWAEFPADKVAWLSEPPRWYRSSARAERGFCPDCGTAISFRYLDGKAVDLAAVTLDAPDSLPPEDELWTESQRAWAPGDARLPRHPRERRKRGDGA